MFLFFLVIGPVKRPTARSLAKNVVFVPRGFAVVLGTKIISANQRRRHLLICLGRGVCRYLFLFVLEMKNVFIHTNLIENCKTGIMYNKKNVSRLYFGGDKLYFKSNDGKFVRGP